MMTRSCILDKLASAHLSVNLLLTIAFAASLGLTLNDAVGLIYDHCYFALKIQYALLRQKRTVNVKQGLNKFSHCSQRVCICRPAHIYLNSQNR